jgi:hypothetical protein
MLDACLRFMAHGSRLMAHGQGRPGEAHGLWPGAGPIGGAGPGPGACPWAPGAGPAPGHEP